MRSLRINLGNAAGSALVVTLLVMVAITSLAIMSINTSTIELQIWRNEQEIRETFYLAEGAAVEGVQRLADTLPIDLEEQLHAWHHSQQQIRGRKLDFRDPTDWDVDGQGQDNGRPSSMESHTYVAAVEWDVATGGSLISTEDRLYVQRVYGLCRKYNSDNIIEIGYKLRY